MGHCESNLDAYFEPNISNDIIWFIKLFSYVLYHVQTPVLIHEEM